MTYYLDAVNGNDDNDGKSPSTAWKTITRLNKQYLRKGDTVLFHAGQTHAGSLPIQSEIQCLEMEPLTAELLARWRREMPPELTGDDTTIDARK